MQVGGGNGQERSMQDNTLNNKELQRKMQVGMCKNGSYNLQ